LKEKKSVGVNSIISKSNHYLSIVKPYILNDISLRDFWNMNILFGISSLTNIGGLIKIIEIRNLNLKLCYTYIKRNSQYCCIGGFVTYAMK